LARSLNSTSSLRLRSPAEDERFLATRKRIMARRNPEKLVREALEMERMNRVLDAIGVREAADPGGRRVGDRRAAGDGDPVPWGWSPAYCGDEGGGAGRRERWLHYPQLHFELGDLGNYKSRDEG
jgi:hypothetical protein